LLACCSSIETSGLFRFFGVFGIRIRNGAADWLELFLDEGRSEIVGEAVGPALSQHLTMETSSALLAGALHALTLLAIANPSILALALIEARTQVAATSLCVTHAGHISTMVNGIARLAMVGATEALFACANVLVGASVQTVSVGRARVRTNVARIEGLALFLHGVAGVTILAGARIGVGAGKGALGVLTTHTRSLMASVDGRASNAIALVARLAGTRVHGGT